MQLSLAVCSPVSIVIGVNLMACFHHLRCQPAVTSAYAFVNQSYSQIRKLNMKTRELTNSKLVRIFSLDCQLQ